MEYRIGKLSDLDEICSVIREVIEEMEKNGIHQWDEIYPARCDFEEDIKKENLYLAWDSDNIVSIYVISRECDEEYKYADWKYPEETSYVLHRFCVSPRYQNKGAGKEILLHIEEQLKEMGCESIRLDVFTLNPFAQKLYQKCGYTKTGYEDWRMGRFDLMEKKI